MPRRRGVRLQIVLGTPKRARRSAHRLRCAAAIRALPSVVLGPVDSPPWKRQRLLPGSTLTRQGAPVWVQAPQRGRSFRRSGEPSPANPSSDRPGRADASGPNSLGSRRAAAVWPGRHQWRLGAQHHHNARALHDVDMQSGAREPKFASRWLDQTAIWGMSMRILGLSLLVFAALLFSSQWPWPIACAECSPASFLPLTPICPSAASLAVLDFPLALVTRW